MRSKFAGGNIAGSKYELSFFNKSASKQQRQNKNSPSNFTPEKVVCHRSNCKIDCVMQA
jgi:hypothetical protein